ncbi:MAG: redoxin domain-containing protein [Bacteroidales bacterium]|nr:redoxin domain-containing protein [Bacteroidales bacterium]
MAVSPENHGNLVEMAEKTNAGYTLLSDTGHLIMDKYDVSFRVNQAYRFKVKVGLQIDLAGHNNQPEAVLPVPAVYVINREKKIVYRHFDVNYKERAPISEIIKNL